MNNEQLQQQRLERLHKLVAWVNEGYGNALRLYGANHPLTRSWLKEKLDIEWFTEHEEDNQHQTFA
ncbi:hypothetical protein EWI61_13340 [Methylolobus aquaticus]|nr:hypothetical protein EWI61_13340 [Methylolobus aquaticus]